MRQVRKSVNTSSVSAQSADPPSPRGRLTKHRPATVILSEGRMSIVETRRANGRAVWISRKNRLCLKNNYILHLIAARSDHFVVALRVSTSVCTMFRPSLKMTRGNGAFAVLNITASIHNTVVARNDKSKFELKLQLRMLRSLFDRNSIHKLPRLLAAHYWVRRLCAGSSPPGACLLF